MTELDKTAAETDRTAERTESETDSERLTPEQVKELIAEALAEYRAELEELKQARASAVDPQEREELKRWMEGVQEDIAALKSKAEQMGMPDNSPNPPAVPGSGAGDPPESGEERKRRRGSLRL